MNKTIYGGFWKRAVAFIVDSIIATLPPLIICLPLMLWQIYSIAKSPDGGLSHLVFLMLLIVAMQVLILLSVWLYFALMESGKRQATWGKQLLKIKVVGRDGGRITFARASGRTFAKIISYMIFYMGYIIAGLTSRKRALHDYIADTYVVTESFQPGDEMPPTPSHPWWIAIISLMMVGLFAAAMVLNALLVQLPFFHSFAVATNLQTMAAQDLPYGTHTTNGVTYSISPDGYRAAFNVNGNNYTLYLSDEYADVCCEETPGTDCSLIGMEPCR